VLLTTKQSTFKILIKNALFSFITQGRMNYNYHFVLSFRNLEAKHTSNAQSNESKETTNDKKKPHIKKPLNAFMLYMKEMRAKVVAECTLKESAAINQILGRRVRYLKKFLFCIC